MNNNNLQSHQMATHTTGTKQTKGEANIKAPHRVRQTQQTVWNGNGRAKKKNDSNLISTVEQRHFMQVPRYVCMRSFY